MVKKEKIDQLLHSLWKEGDISYNRALQDVQIALDSMNEEQVSDKLGGINNALSQDKLAMKSVDEAMAEVEEKAKAFTEAHKGEDSEIILAEMRGEEIASEELEEAAKNYMRSQNPPIWGLYYGFKAGAQWQKQQIMKEAVDGLVVCDELTHGYKDIAMHIPDSLEVGDKVKVIVIKED